MKYFIQLDKHFIRLDKILYAQIIAHINLPVKERPTMYMKLVSIVVYYVKLMIEFFEIVYGEYKHACEIGSH